MTIAAFLLHILGRKKSTFEKRTWSVLLKIGVIGKSNAFCEQLKIELLTFDGDHSPTPMPPMNLPAMIMETEPWAEAPAIRQKERINNQPKISREKTTFKKQRRSRCHKILAAVFANGLYLATTTKFSTAKNWFVFQNY
jgi:hypothetical protein